MSDEVRDMMGVALAGEPALGLEFDRVVADGRRRRTRRRVAALAGTAAGIVTVVAATTALTGLAGSAPAQPAGSASATAAPAHPGCVVPASANGFIDLPRGTASPAELSESGRLTEAFRKVALPAGVEASQVQLCVIRDSWGGTIPLTGGQRVTVYLRPRGGQAPGECVSHPGAECSVRTLPDGSIARVNSPDPSLVYIEVWRADGTFVRVDETGGDVSTKRVLSDDVLLALATAPQLKVELSGPPMPAEPSDRRAAELDTVIATALPAGLSAEPAPGSDRGWRFRVSQGGYKAYANLTDAKGTGWALVELQAPADGAVTCGNQPGCASVDLAGGRKGAVTTTVQQPGNVTVVTLNARAADGTMITVLTSDAEMGTGHRSRPTPPLSEADLVRIAELPGLHW
ncbi:hypothetical protein Amsp01_056470 [Amycolatopsis sp. NBRC 101858]|uniref:hypothetical protein n=1 Tax=Amycolatopsis sp. NBRC 101858 TaxID=3032200 RepID=UPI0024A268B2|nr:hypothetical protein [Amycolatopsis sp. NBRC 101858]GLY39623.1 hypothetical protein Amsp01_056470 [Amycolatopsis sp. NBRC 101858]